MRRQVRPYRKEVTARCNALHRRPLRTNAGRGFLRPRCRLFLPLATFLQALDHRHYDVLIVSDRAASSFRPWHRRLRQFASRPRPASVGFRRPAETIDSVITYGTSMGGMPALRMGQLMEADRAIAAGGRFAWNVGRLLHSEAHDPGFRPALPLPAAQHDGKLRHLQRRRRHGRRKCQPPFGHLPRLLHDRATLRRSQLSLCHQESAKAG